VNDAIVFRRARREDTDTLAEFATRIYYETFVAVNTPENMQAYLAATFNPAQLQSELNDPAAVFLLAHINNKLAAYAKLFPGDAPECVTGPAPIELVRFYVDQSWHGRGVASALMETCLAEAGRCGFKTLYLGVWENNDRAKAFYKKWNFVRVGEHIFQMGDDPQIDWWMVRSI
jgi:GNAT superfamily N-acetyltransferase